MTPPLWLCVLVVAIGGAIGAISRYAVGLAMLRWHSDAGPVGTYAVNVAGCFLIGVLFPLAQRPNLPPLAALMLITGFCGALTTFSTFGHEAILLATERRQIDLAFLYVVGSIVSGIGAVWLGRAVVRWLIS